MKALVYRGDGRVALEDRPVPTLQEPTDVIIRVSKTTVCGTDLAILKGGVPSCRPGRIIGHEATGHIVQAGPAVLGFKPGDHVIIPCTSSCGRCNSCRKGLFSGCDRGGWLIGNLIDGVQAEYARIPLADTSLHLIPPGMDEEAALMLADIIPTGLEVGIQKAQVSLGDTVAVIGAGPVGLATIMAAQFYAPARIISIDIDDNRLAKAKELGASVAINNRDGGAYEQIMALTNGRGVDAVIEVIGNPSTFLLAQQIIGSGGRMANIGVFSKASEIHNEKLWTRNISLHMGVVNTNTVPVLIKMIQAGKFDPTGLISHHFRFRDIEQAYELFRNAAQERAIKIVLTNDDAPSAPAASDDRLIETIVKQVLAAL